MTGASSSVKPAGLLQSWLSLLQCGISHLLPRPRWSTNTSILLSPSFSFGEIPLQPPLPCPSGLERGLHESLFAPSHCFPPCLPVREICRFQFPVAWEEVMYREGQRVCFSWGKFWLRKGEVDTEPWKGYQSTSVFTFWPAWRGPSGQEG